jgi:hypothetical protein
VQSSKSKEIASVRKPINQARAKLWNLKKGNQSNKSEAFAAVNSAHLQ